MPVTVAFNQFHDILCGSAVHESNRESIAAYDLALEKAEGARYGALRFLAAQVPTQAHAGQPLLVSTRSRSIAPISWRRRFS